MSRLAEEAHMETFEEADDFEVGDDYDPQSPYELDEDQQSYDHRNDSRPETKEGTPDKGDRQHPETADERSSESIQKSGEGVTPDQPHLGKS